QFDFASTDELEDLDAVLGQDRAVEAVDFGTSMRRDGYNLFALGVPGLGMRSIITRFLEARAGGEPVPSDWCYVNNFDEPHKPQAIELPSGRGHALRDDMNRLVGELRSAIPAAFESDDYRTRRDMIEEEVKEQQDKLVSAVAEEATERDIALVRTPLGFTFAPTSDGKVVSPEAFQSYSKEDQRRIAANIEALQKRLEEAMRKVPALVKESRARIRRLNGETAEFAVGGLIDEVRRNYVDLPEVLSYLDAVKADVVEHVDEFTKAKEAAPMPPVLAGAQLGQQSFRRYRVNLIVDHGDNGHAPVVYEDEPTYPNLIGRVEHRSELGALITDFDLIKPGALHGANGGYLVLDARKLLLQPFAWEGLKRALSGRCIKIEPLGHAVGLLSTVALEPEPIPVRLKVVLIGEPIIYYLLAAYDPDFGELFKVAADFGDRMDRTPDASLAFARQVATLARRDGLRAFDRGGVARVVEEAARMAQDAEKLTAQVDRIADLLREADHFAAQNGNELVSAADVERAVEARVHRHDRLREQIQDEVERGTILIDTAGEVIGQVNGLSVVTLGSYAFGRPSRITARVRLGRGEVVDIEREVELGGPIHSKGVLILGAYLGARYAQEQPLSLSASVVFEQSYGGVEGDSASSAELYALISALAEVPTKQSLAVTGSVNQRGQVQAIGGVNEKIEGFFALCQARGLSGDQGVLIPASNVKHLMLRQVVVEAVEAGRFHIYPVETIDQGIALLTGLDAGDRDADGRFPEGTINRRAEDRLKELAEKRRRFGTPELAASDR
ncbi:MAG: Lon protease family protein, partial [Kiloniellales bacterium]